MSLRRGHARADLMGDINVVSLIDVMMILLVIFMITAPIMQGGVDVQLPVGASQPLDPKSGLVITVTRDRIFVDETAYTDREFRSAFKLLAGTRAKEGVYFRGDARVDYQRVLWVIGIAQAAGVKNLGLITLPPEEDGR